MWPEADKTEELLEGARQGDDDAIGRLLQRHRDAVRRMIDLRLDRNIRQRVDASDIVQEVLMEANRRLQAYLENPSMPFHLWLRQMAKDRLIDAHRRHRVSGKRSVDREQSLMPRSSYDRTTVEMVEAALEEMEEPDREVIVMRHFEQLSNQEVAQLLELSEPAASMRYLRAMRRLRQRLAESGLEE